MTDKPKTAKTAKTVDMSPAAVANRVEDLRQLYRLMLSLKTIRILGPLSEHEKLKTRSRD